MPGPMPYREVEVLPSTDVTTSGSGDTIDGFAEYSTVRVIVNATSLVLAPTNGKLTLQLEDTIDGQAYAPVGSVSTTSGGAQVFAFDVPSPFADRLRLTYILNGASSATLSASVVAQAPSV